jgi:hypothetical protein
MASYNSDDSFPPEQRNDDDDDVPVNDDDDDDDVPVNDDDDDDDDDGDEQEDDTLPIYDKHLSKTESKDLGTTLEHIVCTGNYHRHQYWRIHMEWKNRKRAAAVMAEIDAANAAAEEEEAKEDDDDDANPSKRKRANKAITCNEDEVLDVHAEDLRLYGRGGSEPAPWPAKATVKSKERAFRDTDWEIEHGDQIHPCRFSANVLAAKPPLQLQLPEPAAVAAAAAATETTSTSAAAPAAADTFMDQGKYSISKEEAPRALLLKCWERAVHAASCVAAVTEQQVAATNKNTNQSDSATGTGSKDDSVRYSAAAANEKVQQLQLVNPSATAPFLCPRCQIDCDTSFQLKDHYFGLENHRGCCWPLIEHAERALLGRVLEADLKAQTNSFLHLVLNKLKQPALPKGAKKSKDPKKIFDWQDVTQLLEQSLAGSIQQTPVTVNADHVLQQTLLVDMEKPPVMINERTVDAITSRINGRYAKVPK